ncbi:MAG TPA: hypothetical protein VMV52_08750 [Candidatus Nanopelagicaceae bacterium]|nr:hypothetical protein [Candidatus Nanopelagicaceae bacterium]
MNDNLLTEIRTQLTELGVPLKSDPSTDISIDAELLDAEWSSGSKKVKYESAILLDEKDQTIYMYEKASEISKGFSFGSSSETSFQHGKTLARKVKATQFGPDGKVFEYSFDLGAIAKTVKKVAEDNHWKFKTVIRRKKASH